MCQRVYVATQKPLQPVQRTRSHPLEAGASLAEFAERGRVVPEVGSPVLRELLVLRYRLMYEVAEHHVYIIAFLHSARDFEKWQRGE